MKNKSIRDCLLVFAVVTASLFAQAGHAAIMVFDDRGDFLAQTGAAATGSYSASVGSTASLTTGDVTLTSDAPSGNSLNSSVNWSTLVPGSPDLALNGVESFNAQTAFDMYSFGFDFHEPSQPFPPVFPDTCNTAAVSCIDSTFSVSLLSGGALVDSFQFERANDSLEFVGVWSSLAFDRVEIREIVGTIDNEFFGNFARGTTAKPVPEPASLALLGLAFAGLGFARRRNRQP